MEATIKGYIGFRVIRDHSGDPCISKQWPPSLGMLKQGPRVSFGLRVVDPCAGTFRLRFPGLGFRV